MIVYNTTFHIEKDILDESLDYLKKQYIPKAVESGFLQRPCLRRVMQAEEGEGISFSVQFHVKNVDTLNFWLRMKEITFTAHWLLVSVIKLPALVLYWKR